MGIKNKKKLKKLDLLEMSNPDRMRLMKEIGETLRQKIMEAKLWQSLTAADDLTINGDVVCKSSQQLNGLKFEGTTGNYR
jgi:ABC-type Fe3+-citrate transport system substrate-binding protein